MTTAIERTDSELHRSLSAADIDADHIHTLDSQVGGHAGVMTTEDGLLIIKPCLPKELEFYNQLAVNEPFAPLRPFIPKMYGTLKQMDSADGAAALASGGLDPSAVGKVLEATSNKGEARPHHAESLVLGNICSSFSSPATMDLKIGTVYYDDDASPEKKAQKIKDAASTTALETGAKITGFQIFDHTTGENISVDKSYGKSLKASELPDAMRRFFPLTSSQSETPEGVGLPKFLLVPVLSGLVEDIQQIRDVLDKMEFRMVNSSLLVVYESNWDSARASLELSKEKETKQHGQEDGGDEDEDEESDEDEEDERKLYAVKLIDFAHTKLTPGRGKDEGVILGLDSTLRLLRGRLEEIQ